MPGKLAQSARTVATVPLDSTNVVYVGRVNLE